MSMSMVAVESLEQTVGRMHVFDGCSICGREAILEEAGYVYGFCG